MGKDDGRRKTTTTTKWWYGRDGDAQGMEIVASLGAISCWNALMQEIANQMSEMSGTLAVT